RSPNGIVWREQRRTQKPHPGAFKAAAHSWLSKVAHAALGNVPVFDRKVRKALNIRGSASSTEANTAICR
ncbi:MAG: hypothetical protein WDA16_03205, partial [Candidatus Thermoplasmatota archaeon]